MRGLLELTVVAEGCARIKAEEGCGEILFREINILTAVGRLVRFLLFLCVHR